MSIRFEQKEKVVPKTFISQRIDGTSVTSSLHDARFTLPSSVTETATMLDHLARKNFSTDTMENIVFSLGEKERLRTFLTDFISRPEFLEQSALASEQHPLGFDKIVLLSSPLYQLRLNIWWPGQQIGEQLNGIEDIHDHKFDFSSKLLKGRIATRLFEFTDEPPLPYHTYYDAIKDPIEGPRVIQWLNRQSSRIAQGLPEEFESREARVYGSDALQNGPDESFQLLGKKYIRLVPPQIIMPAETVYSLTHNTYHLAFPISSDELTATLFFRGSPVIPSDTVVRTGREREQNNAPKVRLSPQKIKEKVERFVNTMN